MGVRIVSDSTADIEAIKAEEWDVALVPLKVIFEKEEYLDGVDLPLDTFYKRLVTDEKLPSTSQPAPEEFLKVFQEAKKSGDDVLVITISSELSGTYQSACIAKELCGYDRIYVVDSRQVTLSMQLMVRRAISLRQNGRSGQEIAEILENEKSRYRLFAVVDDLKYLHKGGRLSKATAAAGTMLNLKPVIEITKEGIVHLAGMARGMNGAYGKIIKMIESFGGRDTEHEFGFGYAGDQETMKQMETYFGARMDITACLENRIGVVIGTHAGPGCVTFACVLNRAE